MKGFLEEAGFKVLTIDSKNYFTPMGSKYHELLQKVEWLMPKSFRDGQTLIGQKKS